MLAAAAAGHGVKGEGGVVPTHDFTWDVSQIDKGILGFSRGGNLVYLNSGDNSVKLAANTIILSSNGSATCENGEFELMPKRAAWFTR